MTEAKYYYDCPIEALYMQKHFGIKFKGIYTDENINSDNFSNEYLIKEFFAISCESNGWQIGGDLKMKVPNKVYIDEFYTDYYSVFLPRGGDVIINKAKWPKPVSKIEDNVAYWSEHGKYHGCSVYDCKIIMRNYKSFIMPKPETSTHQPL